MQVDKEIVMETKYSEAAKAAFQKQAIKTVDKIANIVWPWTVPNTVEDLAKMVKAAIELGGLDPQFVTEFTEEETEKLGKKLEMFRRLEMKAETREFLLTTLTNHGITLEIPESVATTK